MRPNAMRQLLLSSTGLVVALGVTSTATAQTDTAGVTLETIVITAERREADIQKTALAVTAISGESLEKTGTSTLNDVLRSVPSVQVQSTGQVAVRGIGTDGVNKLPSTAIYQDGISVYNLGGYYYDLARVEVLAGPQGTLYGGTATGGAVNVITNNPKSKFEALAQGELGNYNLRHTTAMVNIPVADSFAIRLAGNWQERDSYVSDKIHGVDQLNFRGKALWDINESLSVLFGAEYFHDTSLGSYIRDVDHTTGEPIDGDYPPGGYNDVTVQKYYLNVNADLGFGELTYIPGLQRFASENLSLGGAFGGQGQTPNGQYLTQELRLASKPGSTVTWVGGVYYYNERSTANGFFGPGVLPFIPFFNVIDDIDNHQIAEFGQVTIPLTSALRFTGGVRYSEDVVKHPQTNNGVLTPFTGHYHSFDYLARVEYDLTDKSLLYGSLSTGYRPGGIAQAPNEYGNEEIKAYEIGSKNTLFNDTLILNGDVFYYDYGGFQTGLTVACTATSFNCYVFEVKSIPAEFKGAELMATWAPTRADTVSLATTYIQSKYTGNAEVSQYVGGPVVPLVTTGHEVTHTAEWAASASYQHTMTFGNDSSLFGRIEASYQGDSYTNFDPCIFSTAACNAPSTPIDFVQKAYTIVNLSAGYAAANDSWAVTAYARNLTDRAYKLSFGPSQATLGAPRTYGVTATKRW